MFDGVRCRSPALKSETHFILTLKTWSSLSPSCRHYPPACKPYGQEAGQEAGSGFFTLLFFDLDHGFIYSNIENLISRAD